MTGDIPLIDTNILVYAYDLSHPEKRASCLGLVEECWSGKRTCALSVQNLSEFYIVLTRKISNPAEDKEAGEIVKRLAAYPYWLILDFNEETVLDALDISQTFWIHYWDALIAATMRNHGISTIYTENVTDFLKVPFLTVVNPIGK